MKSFFDFSIERGDPGGFGLFGAAHFAYLAIAAAATALLCAVYKRADAVRRARLRKAVALAALALELLRAALLAAAGKYDIGRLPLHLCTMAVYFNALHALRPTRLGGQFLYAFCMPGALAALLFPDWNYYPPLHFMTLCSFLLHILLADYTLMQLRGGDIAPEPRLAPACLALMLPLAAALFVFDRATGTNYMFLNWPSPGSPLEWFAFLGRPGYLLGYFPLLAAVWAVLYGPALLRERKSGLIK